jgi:hypothetical protein
MSLSKRASVMSFQRAVVEYGGGGGILSEQPKKFSVAMVKRNFFVVNEQIIEKPFCQCYWRI